MSLYSIISPNPTASTENNQQDDQQRALAVQAKVEDDWSRRGLWCCYDTITTQENLEQIELYSQC